MPGFDRDFIRAFERTVKQGTKGILGEVVAVTEALSEAVKSPSGRAQLEAAHERVATQMRLAVVQSYMNEVEAHVQNSYVRANRYGGGALKRALQSPTMARGTANGIEFVDERLLNAEAKHWARLNWGTSERSQAPARRFFLIAGGRKISSPLGFYRASTRPPLMMPGVVTAGGKLTIAGAFVDSGGKSRKASADRLGLDKFFPGGSQLIYPTRGIKGRHYLDAGFEALVDQGRGLPYEYDQLIKLWLRQSSSAGTKYKAAKKLHSP